MARRIPATPNIRPPTTKVIKIQIEDTPRVSPNNFGLMIYPSIVCKMTVKIKNQSAYHGLTSTRINAPTTAPTIGPNVGAIFVTPTTTEINKA